jgi:putative ABC transport system substrate-binding protein
MRRREFIILLGGAAAWPLAAHAQQSAKKMFRVGTVSEAPKLSPQWTAFVRRMAELGYQEGKTFSFDLVPAANEDEYETGYRRLAARELDIVLATGSEIALKSALAATRTLPIVMIAIDFDPFARGYVTNLARPSGNVTGVFFQQIELAAKRIQLVKEALPDAQARSCFGTGRLPTSGKRRKTPPRRSASGFPESSCVSRLMITIGRYARRRPIIAA